MLLWWWCLQDDNCCMHILIQIVISAVFLLKWWWLGQEQHHTVLQCVPESVMLQCWWCYRVIVLQFWVCDFFWCTKWCMERHWKEPWLVILKMICCKKYVFKGSVQGVIYSIGSLYKKKLQWRWCLMKYWSWFLSLGNKEKEMKREVLVSCVKLKMRKSDWRLSVHFLVIIMMRKNIYMMHK